MLQDISGESGLRRSMRLLRGNSHYAEFHFFVGANARAFIACSNSEATTMDLL